MKPLLFIQITPSARSLGFLQNLQDEICDWLVYDSFEVNTSFISRTTISRKHMGSD